MGEHEVWKRIIFAIGHWTVMGFGSWAIEEKATGAFIGQVGFFDAHRDGLPSTHGVPETGWMIAPDRQGNGFASEAVKAAHEWIDSTLDCSRTFCMIMPEHAISLHIAKTVGYEIKEEITYQEHAWQLLERPLLTDGKR
jgi:RimJ/RimL family protein N-acetyltransferase